MKILRVIASMKPEQGGPCQGIRNSIPEMKKYGGENEVVCFDDPCAGYLGKDDFVIHTLGEARGPWAYNKALVPWLAENFNRFDVVIIHGLWLYHSYATYKAWQKFKKTQTNCPKLFVMPHGMLDPYFQKAPDRKIKAIRNTLFWHLFEKRVINGIDGVLFTCQRELELARETFNGYSPKKEINVTYGIQAPPTFNESMEVDFLNKSGLIKGERFMLFLSRIHSKKGIDLLIKAYMNLKDKVGLTDIAKLVIAGPLNTNFSEGLVSLAIGRNDIIFTGMLQGNAKWGALYLSEAFILPSHQENFGIAVAEALACGIPVLITDKVNIYKEILAFDAGLVFEDTGKANQDMLVEWSNTTQQRKEELSNNALKVYTSKFSIDNSVKEMVYQLEINS